MFVHFPVGPGGVPLIAQMPRVCHVQMQHLRFLYLLLKSADKKPPTTAQLSWLCYPSPLLARFRSPIDASSKSSLVAPTSSFNCARLVALAIGAVTVGRAISHASATRTGVA